MEADAMDVIRRLAGQVAELTVRLAVAEARLAAMDAEGEKDPENVED